MLYKPALFILQAIIIALVAALHLSALQWYLYWYFPWLDLLSHFLGGLWIALAAAWFLAYVGQRPSLMRLITIAMLIGIGWEFFEILIGTPREANFAFDTTLDLITDFIGALFGYLVAHRLLRESVVQ